MVGYIVFRGVGGVIIVTVYSGFRGGGGWLGSSVFLGGVCGLGLFGGLFGGLAVFWGLFWCCFARGGLVWVFAVCVVGLALTGG